MTAKKTAPPSGKPDTEDGRTDEATVIHGGEGGGMLLSTRHRRPVPSGALIIVSRQPGLRRAGVPHPAVKVYEPGHFDELEMAQILAEPLLEVIGVY